MTPYEIIRAKRDGGTLPADALREFVAAYGRGEVPDYQMAALCMAVFFRGFDGTELRTWTEAMLRSGGTLRRWARSPARVDKHSTGGVGDKVSLCLAPLVAACGVAVFTAVAVFEAVAPMAAPMSMFHSKHPILLM
ncbi:MAG: hypothetical protein EHM78_13250, partial [Myxococcaceae bacterium]